MVREIVFHLGDCKTGTTSIQSALASGAIQSETRICYPARFNHIPLAKTLSAGPESAFQKKRFANVRRAFDRSKNDIGVISAEHFEFVAPDEIKRAIDRHLPDYKDRVRLIAYVRPHADRLLSTFVERSKKGQARRTIDVLHARLLDQRMLFYTPRFARLKELFGDQFTLRPFVRDELRDGDVVTDFLHHLLRGSPYTLTAPLQPNESLSLRDVAMMRHVQRKISEIMEDNMPMREAQRALGWYMSDLLTALPQESPEKPRLHRALAKKMADIYAEDAAALDAMFFDGTPMSDALANAPEKAVETPQSFRAEDHLSAHELRQAEAWATLMARMINADPHHFSWSVRPAAQRNPDPPKPRAKP